MSIIDEPGFCMNCSIQLGGWTADAFCKPCEEARKKPRSCLRCDKVFKTTPERRICPNCTNSHKHLEANSGFKSAPTALARIGRVWKHFS